MVIVLVVIVMLASMVVIMVAFHVVINVMINVPLPVIEIAILIVSVDVLYFAPRTAELLAPVAAA
jgi:hypothetical protein